MAFRLSSIDPFSDQWSHLCTFWGENEETGTSLYSSFVIAPAPSKDLLQICVKPDEVIVRHIPLVPPTRASFHSSMPYDEKCSYNEFLDNKPNYQDINVRETVLRCFGDRETVYVDNLLDGRIDFFARIPTPLITRILQLLHSSDLYNVVQLSKKFKKIADSDDVWRVLFKKEITKKLSEDMEMVSMNCGWKSCFKLFYIKEKKGSKMTEVSFCERRRSSERSTIANISVIGGP